MRVVVTGRNVIAVTQFRDLAVTIDKRWEGEAMRGLTDAGRRTKTQVQRAVFKQMAMKPGTYTSFVVHNTRGVPRKKKLSFEIFSYRGGAKINQYKGLKDVAPRGAAARRLNEGRDPADRGTVRSGVWNRPRIFKRSFSYRKGWFAMLPGRTHKAPKLFWTYGWKKNQPRSADGRFARSKRRYGKIRRLFGPALSKEIPQGDSLVTFRKVAPKLMREKIDRRMAKLMKY